MESPDTEQRCAAADGRLWHLRCAGRKGQAMHSGRPGIGLPPDRYGPDVWQRGNRRRSRPGKRPTPAGHFYHHKTVPPQRRLPKGKSGDRKSLHELQTDYIDLVLIHEPYENAPEMYEALKEAYQAGKIRAIGVSNFDAQRYWAFIRTCGVIPAVDQVESHVYYPALPGIG